MSNLDKVIETKIQDNINLRKIYNLSIAKRKIEISDKALKINSIQECKDILTSVTSLLVDFTTLDSLESEYKQLMQTDNQVE